MSRPSQGVGGVSVSQPRDDTLVDEGNNNEDGGGNVIDLVPGVQEVTAEGRDVPYTIRVPAANFSVHASVFYTHFYYKKLRGQNGSPDPFQAQCLMCWEKFKKVVLLKITSTTQKVCLPDIQLFFVLFILINVDF